MQGSLAARRHRWVVTVCRLPAECSYSWKTPQRHSNNISSMGSLDAHMHQCKNKPDVLNCSLSNGSLLLHLHPLASFGSVSAQTVPRQIKTSGQFEGENRRKDHQTIDDKSEYVKFMLTSVQESLFSVERWSSLLWIAVLLPAPRTPEGQHGDAFCSHRVHCLLAICHDTLH